MNTLRIKVLMTAIECGSLTKAGQKLGYTQSYLTQMMKSLEDECGFPLLLKTNRGVEPTHEAQLLLPAMRNLINSEEKLEREMAEIQGIHKGTITIGSFVSTSVHWIPQLLEFFQSHYPDVSFQIEEMGQDEMISGLTDGSLDLALMSKPSKSKKENIDFIPVADDPMLVVFTDKYDLSQYDYVPIEVLKDYPFIMSYKSFDKDPYEVFESAGFMPEVMYQSRDDFAVLSMVQRGLGLAVLPELAIFDVPGNHESRMLSPESYRTLGVGIKSKDAAGPLARRIIKYLKENIK